MTSQQYELRNAAVVPDPDNARSAVEEAQEHIDRAVTAFLDGDGATQTRELTAALDVLDRQQVRDSLVLDVLESLSALYYEHERWAEAEVCLARAIELRDAGFTLESDIDATDKADRLLELAFCRLHQNKPDSVAPAERAVAIYEREYGSRDEATADALADLSDILAFHGRNTEAEATRARALDVHLETVGESSESVADDLDALAFIYQMEDRFEEASLLQERAQLIRQVVGSSPLEVGANLSNQAVAARERGDFARAVSLTEASLVEFRKVFAPTDFGITSAEDELAELYLKAGQPMKAIAHLEEILGRTSDADETKLEKTTRARRILILSDACEIMGDLQRAERLCFDATAYLRMNWGPRAANLEEPLTKIVAYLDARGSSAVETYRKELAEVRELAAKDGAAQWMDYYASSMLAAQEGDLESAKSCAMKAREIAFALDSATHVAMTHHWMAVLLLNQQEPSKAAAECQKAVELMESKLGRDDFILHRLLKLHARALGESNQVEAEAAVQERIRAIEKLWDKDDAGAESEETAGSGPGSN